MVDSVNVIISTYSIYRYELLKKCIDSILNGAYKNVKITVGVNGNYELLESVKQLPVEVRFSKKNLGYIPMMNGMVAENTSDLILYGADDVLFDNDCISLVVKEMQKRFPDGDGLVSINQKNLSWGLDTAFGIFGNKFAERFLYKMVYCVDYAHGYSDNELGLYAKSIEKHYHCVKARLFHDRIRDESHLQARSMIHQDKDIYMMRRECDFLWGKNFDLVSC